MDLDGPRPLDVGWYTAAVVGGGVALAGVLTACASWYVPRWLWLGRQVDRTARV